MAIKNPAVGEKYFTPSIVLLPVEVEIIHNFPDRESSLVKTTTQEVEIKWSDLFTREECPER